MYDYPMTCAVFASSDNVYSAFLGFSFTSLRTVFSSR
jgi:hypothetical protein